MSCPCCLQSFSLMVIPSPELQATAAEIDLWVAGVATIGLFRRSEGFVKAISSQNDHEGSIGPVAKLVCEIITM